MYKVFFNDSSIFKGGNPKDTKWEELSHKPIKKIELTIGGKTLVMENYELYNLTNELAIFINKPGRRGGVTKLLLMGSKGNNILLIIYDFIKRKVSYDGKDWGKEWRGKPTTGWKLGVSNQKPKMYIK